jgi:putative ABC transport system permease protein
MEELFEIIKLAIHALKTNRMRSFLTMLGVIIGVASVILLVSIGSGLRSYITGQLERLGAKTLMVIPGSSIELGSSGGGGGGVPGAGMMASKFTVTHVRELEKADSVNRVMPYTENNGTLRYGKNSHITQVAGVGYEYITIRNHNVEDGRFFSKAEEESAKKVVVLGKTVVEKLFGGENPINKKMTIGDGRFTVVGVLERMGAFGGVDIDDQAFIPANTALKQFDMDYFMTIFVEAKSQENIEETKTEVKRILLKYLKEDEFSVLDTKNLLNTIASILGVLTIALGGIAAISLIVGGIGIANIMLVSVTERTREIGLRKAVGATPQIIMIQFLSEAVILSATGGIIGIILGILSSLVLGKFAPTIVTGWSIMVAFIVSSAVGIIFGLAPAVRASRLTPVDALRYE